MVAVSYGRGGALDAFVSGTDVPLSLDVAKAKGYIESEDITEQAYYEDMLRTMDMDSDEARGGLTPDATPFSEQ